MLFEALHCTAVSSQTPHKAKNIQPPDSEGLLARCAISEWRGSSRGSLAIALMRGRARPALALALCQRPTQVFAGFVRHPLAP